MLALVQSPLLLKYIQVQLQLVATCLNAADGIMLMIPTGALYKYFPA